MAGSLPCGLRDLGIDIRIVMPGYRSVLQRYGNDCSLVGQTEIPGESVRILETRLPGTRVPVYIVDAKGAFDRPGGPYQGPDNQDWPDNWARFATFCRAIVEMSMGRTELRWRPNIVHCNDWQTGLVPALLSKESNRPATLFTVHNLAYQGLFSYEEFQRLALPEEFWSDQALEFNGHLSFIKGGLVYADSLVTVSPTYAEEIQTPEFGYGLDGLLRHRLANLVGIVNGIDTDEWNPQNDPDITYCYDANSLEAKSLNKFVLQKELGLAPLPSAVLLAHIGRLAHQKGTELILGSLPGIMRNENVQVVILGTGDTRLEKALDDMSGRWPERMKVCARFSEPLAHRIEAGADIFLMPSIYEPCGLNQMYSMRYGTIPVVRRTGGLKDTVTCFGCTPETADRATGFCFEDATPEALTKAVHEAINLYSAEPDVWRQMMEAGMTRDFSWRRSALAYRDVYRM